MKSGRLITLFLFAFLCLAGSSLGATPLKVVASFSILGDMATQLGGDKVEVVTLVGPDQDAHVFEPTPADAKVLKNADLVVVNGLGFEGWMDRLVKASGFSGKIVVASEGVKPRAMAEVEHEKANGHEEMHYDHANRDQDHEHGHHHHHGDIDPHAWQSLANGKIYAQNITKALITADPANKDEYKQAGDTYLRELDALEAWVRDQFTRIPNAKKRMITSHDAFGYFGDAYGVEMLAPMGISTANEPSAGEVKELIRQINTEKITAVFVENISDRRLINQIARESKVTVEGALYSDALSKKDGPASSYLGMFKTNVNMIVAAMQQGL